MPECIQGLLHNELQTLDTFLVEAQCNFEWGRQEWGKAESRAHDVVCVCQANLEVCAGRVSLRHVHHTVDVRSVRPTTPHRSEAALTSPAPENLSTIFFSRAKNLLFAINVSSLVHCTSHACAVAFQQLIVLQSMRGEWAAPVNNHLESTPNLPEHSMKQAYCPQTLRRLQ
jgi:hypothetical protein